MVRTAIAIIDGTGPYFNCNYLEEMKGSFCDQLQGMFPLHHYERGPSVEGTFIKTRAERAAEFLISEKQRDPRVKLALAGYSRGGSIAVIAAERIRKAIGAFIDGMFLFDPVDRHNSGDTKFIPMNVQRCFVARRFIDHPDMKKYDYSLSDFGAIQNVIGVVFASQFLNHNPARNWFGSTATRCMSSATNFVERSFLGSHGALGGVGWTHVVEDPDCQRNVANFMNAALLTARCIPIGTLSSKVPSCAPPDPAYNPLYSPVVDQRIRKLGHPIGRHGSVDAK